MPTSSKRNSFLLRVWWEETEANPDGKCLWRAWVQHIRSGEDIYVEEVEALLSFIERWAGRLRGSQASSEEAGND